MVGRLWLIGGTGDSAWLSKRLAAAHVPCTITVTTAAACRLYDQCPWRRVRVGRLTPAQIETFLYQESIGAVLDASHPFAAAVSELAIATAQRYQLPYLRYERPVRHAQSAWIQPVSSVAALLPDLPAPEERILLLVGRRWLSRFQPWQQQAALFTRILPTQAALAAARAAGFSSDRILALRPPVSAALEAALWQQWQITRVITKASGGSGETIKIQVAQQLGVPICVIQRPQVSYPSQTESPEKAVQWAIELTQRAGPDHFKNHSAIRK